MEVEQNTPVTVKKEIVEKEEAVCDTNTSVKVEVEEKEERMEVEGQSSAPLKEEAVCDTNTSMKVEVEEKEERMEVEQQSSAPSKEEELDDADTGQITIRVEPKSEGLVKLIVDGIEDDKNEETVVMTPDEIRTYLQLKISGYTQDPDVNPLLGLKKRILQQQEEIKDKSDEIAKLSKAFDLMCRNQEKFLRHIGIFPQLQMSTVAVSVDMPVLANAVLPISPAKNGQESLLKKDVTESKILSPSIPNTTAPKPALPNPTTPKPTIPSTAATNANSVLKSNASTDTPKSAPKPSTGNIECIDLTDDTAPPVKTPSAAAVSTFAALTMIRHPAPLPPKPFSATNNNLPSVPPKPRLKISAEERGIVLQWDMPPNKAPNTLYTKLSAFDIFGYQEQKNMVINTLLWKKIGTVKAMNLPMACTLTQFLEGNKYHFAVRAVDIYNRCGSYSDPISIVYKQAKPAQKT